MTLRLYDTFSRTVRDFQPLDPPTVGLYACGPTVYDYAHIGNLRTYVFEDVLRRTMAFNGYNVRHIVNITDVGHLTDDADMGEDKMEAGSRRTGKSAYELADLYTRAFQDDLKRLHILEPTIWCRATEHIPEQIELVRCIEKKGYTYRTDDGIYFDTSKLPDYGHMARLDIEGLQAGARVDMGQKRHPTDFALWKFSPEGQKRQMEWDSPWGVGFPGWHVECSAMSARYLGPLFDIHCGGEDHISVHHTNEIAQTQACYGTNLANYWLHGYFLQFDREKMAKSAGRFVRVQDLIDQGYDPLAFRYFCLMGHYRSKLSFNWESLAGAGTALDRLRQAMYDWGEAGEPDAGYMERFEAHTNNDLDMPGALALTWELVKSDLPPATKKGTLCRFDHVLGLGLMDWTPAEDVIPDEIAALAEQRQAARAARNWAEADALRCATRYRPPATWSRTRRPARAYARRS